ncbi:TIGR03086 family protein [Epidermidibacterium keratini]|uniref:TIGR03086 family protein n=1 Tax=Epidermidibacterium keratini TaxID=1891644 RepID=A0A7L4YPZ5_9ACTN|nr:TIGR03086 family protein [Epidermidibacterium keratini]QHC01236.1 TIGR03086 family protein [Epidermidibacterium keratini]
MSTPSRRHADWARGFAQQIDNVTDWSAPSPVEQWAAVDVVEHLLAWPVGLLRDWAGIELTDDADATPAERWRRRSAELQSVLDGEAGRRTVEVGPFAGTSVAELIDRLYSADVFMHTWDLARAAGHDPQLDPAYATQLLEGMRQMEQVLRDSGQYGAPYPTTSADPVEQLMAFIGRDPPWSAATP